MLANILTEETDERHPMPMAELVDRLARFGVTAERKSLYRDLAALRKHGLDVVYRAGTDGGWYVENRTFTPLDLRAIIDAVSVYRWIPESQKQELLNKLVNQAPVPQRKSLRRPVSVRRRSAADPLDLRAVLDRIHAAIQNRKALSFVPYTYDRGKTRTPEDSRRVISPKGLIWAGETYQLLAWDHRDRVIRLYRPDRMGEVLVTGLPAQGPEADAGLWDAAPFGLDPNRRERIRLRCCQTLAGEVMDRFGADVKLVPDGDSFLLTADVVMGPEFWGWMTIHADRAEVIAPPWAAKQWQDRFKSRLLERVRQPKAV
jgi:predicted DNA-binding transcriptional regulator YafY